MSAFYTLRGEIKVRYGEEVRSILRDLDGLSTELSVVLAEDLDEVLEDGDEATVMVVAGIYCSVDRREAIDAAIRRLAPHVVRPAVLDGWYEGEGECNLYVGPAEGRAQAEFEHTRDTVLRLCGPFPAARALELIAAIAAQGAGA